MYDTKDPYDSNCFSLSVLSDFIEIAYEYSLSKNKNKWYSNAACK